MNTCSNIFFYIPSKDLILTEFRYTLHEPHPGKFLGPALWGLFGFLVSLGIQGYMRPS